MNHILLFFNKNALLHCHGPQPFAHLLILTVSHVLHAHYLQPTLSKQKIGDIINMEEDLTIKLLRAGHSEFRRRQRSSQVET